MKASKGNAWVTGAGTGIGRGVALQLARDGWKVAVSARTETDLKSLAEEASGIEVFALDVTDEIAVARAAHAIEAAIGPLDLVVLSAGTYKRVSAKGFSVATFRQTIDVNLMGSVHCLAAIMPGMLARHSGHIAVVASVTGYVGLPSAAAYGASKAALNNMCEALQPELAAEGVTMTVINPGFVDTPLTKKNEFPMPFIIPVDEAVRHIMSGLEAKRFEIVFPWQMAVSIKLLARLPDWLKFAITRRMVS